MTANYRKDNILDKITDITENGFFLAKEVFTADEVERIEKTIKKIHNIDDIDFPACKTCADAVNKYPELIEFVANEKLISAVKSQIGDNAKFLQHCDVHANAGNWNGRCPLHRDSTCRKGFECKGADWDESEPFLIVRTAIYTRPHALAVIPKSHVVSGRDEKKIIDVSTEPGDVVIFDSRLLHSGTKFNKPKYSIFFCYGIPNKHFTNYLDWYLYKRVDLKYKPLSQFVEDQLSSKNLLNKITQSECLPKL